jgi:hypothetical protein
VIPTFKKSAAVIIAVGILSVLINAAYQNRHFFCKADKEAMQELMISRLSRADLKSKYKYLDSKNLLLSRHPECCVVRSYTSGNKFNYGDSYNNHPIDSDAYYYIKLRKMFFNNIEDGVVKFDPIIQKPYVFIVEFDKCGSPLTLWTGGVEGSLRWD